MIFAETSTIKYEYTYDDRGNILTEKEYAVTVDENGEKVYTLIEANTDTYVYDETWKDKLISYNGQTITYDAVGNPINYMGNALTWTMGRQLASFGNISYKYNEDGIRTSKTSNGVTTKFYLNGTNIIEQTDGTTTFYFFYDSVGEIVGFKYNGNNYLYVKNPMGDIIGISDAAGNLIASYTYDAWGKVTSVTGSNTAIGELNPFRYRSYYYDSDIQLYYLQSRYYDPEIGRFINSDDVNIIDLLLLGKYNPYSYCWNCPNMSVDLLGYIALPGTIHRQVVLHIKEKNKNLEISQVKILYSNGGYGYCDVINPATGAIWEVKRCTISKTKALKQLDKYVAGTYKHNPDLKLKRGGYLSGDSFTYKNFATTYYVSYWYAGDGIIYYEYNKDSNLVPDPQVMEQMVYVLIAYYTILTVLTALTGGATAGGFLVPVPI